MDRRISNIYTVNPLTVESNTSIHNCIDLMRKNRISCLIVCDEKKPVGIYTEADIVRSLNKEIDYHSATIRELMSAPIITATDDINVFEATYLMTSNNIRHLVITNKVGDLAGIVTQTDVIAHYGEDYFIGAKSVNNVMTKKILLVDIKEVLHEVVNQMENYTAGCAIAVEKNRPVGILTERDMAALIIKEADINSLIMEEVMTNPVITVPISMSTFDAIGTMNRYKVRRIVAVNEEGEIAGVLIQEDIIRDLERNYVEFLKEVLWERDQKLAITQQEYQTQSSRLDSLLNSSLDMSVIVTDVKFNVVYLNHDGAMMFQVGKEKKIGMPLDHILCCDSVNEQSLTQVRDEVAKKGEYWFIHMRNEDQCLHHIESRLTPIFEQGELVGYTVVSRDITDKLHTEKRLLLASHVFECAIEGIMVTDADGTIQLVNPAFTSITGYLEKEAVGKNPRILQSSRQAPEFYEKMWSTILSTGRWQGEIWNRRKSGEVYPSRLTITSVKDLNGNVIQYTAVFYDITDIKEKEEKINHRAYHDPLTELPNRLLFKDRLEQAITHARRSSTVLAVMFIDIDHFKRLNDTQGHQVGDQFLQLISSELRGLLREEDTVSRFAGDEFTILLAANNNLEHAVIVAQKILNLFSKPFQIKNNEVYLGVSIGIACYPNDGNNPDMLIKNADTAMYHAKENGRNRFQVFEQEMEIRIKQRVSLESELRKALGNDQLDIHYQPIVNLHSRKITSIEALLRWDNANKEVSPEQFIPIAEESGLIVPIGKWVLQQTCRRISEWQIDDVTGLAVSVNISARQFREKELLTTIERILIETEINPEQLHIEITETSVMEDMDRSIAILNGLKELGIQILLDDFGTGYSSLTCLQRFPVDVLKLDHTFIHSIDQDADAARLAAGIISMAKDLRLEVVAEGVENEAQLKFLEDHGCDMVQGYLFHKPLTEEQLKEVLELQRLDA
ncbi:EAL domain-containing protein [Pseudomonadota bacterium]